MIDHRYRYHLLNVIEHMLTRLVARVTSVTDFEFTIYHCTTMSSSTMSLRSALLCPPASRTCSLTGVRPARGFGPNHATVECLSPPRLPLDHACRHGRQRDEQTTTTTTRMSSGIIIRRHHKIAPHFDRQQSKSCTEDVRLEEKAIAIMEGREEFDPK